ncbi:Exocyst complex component S5 [Malassezia cuniculi]|uniref:Exocyst complex component SEC5 n=1 Tax=Malassezia cuniculi TaxID=948313 RepID=A0AAF0J5D4_9BASI|nr:Exocyst complex component S5 [Malassezia cuniculi]
MSRLRVDEDALLKAYNLDSLYPIRWEDPKANRAASEKAEPVTEAPVTEDSLTDPLGLRPAVPGARLDLDTRRKIALGSKTFDPKTFLNTVHPDASFAELSQGVAHLRGSISQRSAALKVLVNENFDRFVSVKATTDGVYREMREQAPAPLASESEFGVAPLRSSLGAASTKADQVFRPLLENNIKMLKLRSTLAVFERSRFFFNLPGSLRESVDAGRYEVALRDYNKGRFLLEQRPGQLLPIHSTDTADGPRVSEAQLAQRKRIFARVWDAVENVMRDMREQLVQHLRDPQRSVEEQEKTIEVLLGLDSNIDPVSIFLESQHAHIGTKVSEALARLMTEIERARSLAGPPPEDAVRVCDLHKCLQLIRTSATTPSFAEALGYDVWVATEELVDGVCSTILRLVPTFWRIARAQAEGRLKGQGATSNSNAQSWALDGIKRFVNTFAAFFSAKSYEMRSHEPLITRLPAWVPVGTCSVSATQHLLNILTTLSDTIGELRPLGIPGARQLLDGLLLDTRFQFIEVLSFLWIQDAKRCHLLETWEPNAQKSSLTAHLRLLSQFNRWNAREAYFIAEARLRSAPNNPANAEIPAGVVTRLQDAFVAALHAFLDGIAIVAKSHSDSLAPALIRPAHDTPPSRDVRMLLGVSNLAQLRTALIPAWTKQFQDAYQTRLASEQATVTDVCARHERELLQDYVRRKAQIISGIVQHGIQHEVNWGALSNPMRVNEYIYHSLLALVQIHAQVRGCTPQLVTPVITTLVEQLASTLLQAFERVPKFNMGGMLQSTLEIEFVHQTMTLYVSPKAEGVLRRVYESISQRYSASAGAEGAATLQRELESVKGILIASRKATALEFLCFRRPRST